MEVDRCSDLSYSRSMYSLQDLQNTNCGCHAFKFFSIVLRKFFIEIQKETYIIMHRVGEYRSKRNKKNHF